MEASASKGVIDGLLGLGLPGIIIIVCFYVIWQLWKRMNDIQDKRLDESKQSTSALIDNSNTLKLLVDTLNKNKAA